ncbi:DUF11 domain-containing protein [Flavobacterium kingsejongi]|uniref:DUF11 domain-containing protein n=1 Tax=Flavobacterium kingsejongi TaxID=1678728 RepID=UPI001472823A|nr:DUF11 domain-containing protein [Flavobacterium kingsejongi]
MTTSINQSTDLIIQKTGSQTATAGAPITYTIKVSNGGPLDVQGLTIQDLIPSDVQNVNWTATATGAAAINGTAAGTTNTIQLTGDIAAGPANYITINITGTVSPSPSATTVSNNATVTSSAAVTDYNLANNSSSVTTIISKETNLAITKTVDNAMPSVGNTVVFTLVAANAGPSDGTGISVTDLLPAGYTYITSTPAAGTAYVPATGIWTIGTLSNATSATLTITASVNPTGPYANTATINGTENDPTPENNSSTVTPVPIATSDRSLVKTVDNENPAVGSTVTFSLAATNNGPSDGTGVTVMDWLPAGYTYVNSVAPVGTTYNSASGLWTIGTLASGTTATLTITATVNATGSYANTATITGNENDPTPGNDSSTSTPTAVPTSDRSIVKTVDNSNPAVGSTVTFSLAATNNGPSDGTGITVTDLLPAGYTYVSSVAPIGTTYDPATGLWNIGTLAGTTTSTLTITATVNATGPYANTASITGTENDPTPGNDSSTATPTAVPTSDRSIVKTVDNENPAVGSTVVFSLAATNNGPSDSTGIVVNDLLPSGYTYVSAVAPTGTTYDFTTGIWNIGTLANAATSTLTITATVNATGSYANTASITGNENDPTPGNDSSSSTPIAVPTSDRAIVKTVDNPNPAVGSTVTFSLAATNNGPSDGTGVTVTDLLPAGYTYVSSVAPIGTNYDPTSGLWTIGTLTGATTSTLTITATVNATGPYANTASITGTENDPTPGNDSSTSTPTAVPTSDRSIVKTVDNSNPAVGSTVTFSLAATNNGPSDGTGVIVTDLLPAGYTYVSSVAPIGTNYDPTSGLWTIGTLAGATTSTLTITATVNATGPYANTASITGTENDPTPDNDSSTATPTAVPTSDRSIVKTVDNENPAVGSTVVFSLAATNNGPSDSTGIVVNDLLPSGYTYVSAVAPTGTTYDFTTGIWNIGTLANAAISTLTITATVNATGSYANTASITGNENDPTPGNDSSSSTPTAVPTSDRAIVKTVDNPNPAVGSTVTFSLAATNNGPSDGTGVTVTDLLPAGYTYVSSVAPIGTNYDPTSGLWTIGTLAGATTSTLTITATVNATGPYANTASITGTENDPTPGNDSSTSTPTAVPTSDRSIVKTVDNENPAVGSTVTFSLAATNNGPSDSTGITVADLLPAGYTYVSNMAPTGTTYDPATGLWTVGTLANGTTSTLTITATVNATGPYANTASITGTENDPTPGNDSSTATPTAVPTTDRSIVKTVDNENPAVGSNVVFTLVATNNGPSDSTGIVVNDLLPSGYTYVSAVAPTGTTYDFTTGIWNIGTLANAATSTLTITATVNATGSYANTASITGNENDPTPGNDSSSSTPIAVPTSDRAIVKTVDNPNPAVGSTVTFSLAATNNGPSDGTGVTVTDLLPAGYTYVSSVAPIGTAYDPTSGLWTIGTLTGATTSTLTITATVNATGPYANTASITGTENDPTPGNDSSTSTPTAVPTSDRAIVKTVSNANPAVGNTVVFTLVATNNGPSDGTGITVTDLLPAGYTYVSATPSTGMTYDPGSGLWTIGMLANEDSATLTITTTVNATGPYANTASITGAENDPTPDNDSSTVTPTAVPTTDRSITKTVDQPNPAVGSNVVFTLVATNNGPSDGTGIIVTDLLPAGYTYVSAIPSIGNYDPATGLWNIGTMTNAATATLPITATVNENGPYANTASITGNENDPAPDNDSATATPTADPRAHLTVVKVIKDPTQTTFVPGEAVIYRISVTNDGPSDAIGVNVQDTPPANTTITSWTAVSSPGVTYPNTTGSGSLNETIATLANGLTAIYDITIQTPSNFTASLVNTANAGSMTPDPTPGPCTTCSSDPVTPTPQAHLNTVKTLNDPTQTSFVPGQAVVYRIAVTNNGPSDATAVNIVDNAPVGTTITGWMTVPSPGVAYPDNSGAGNLNETITLLANGQTAIYEVTVQTPADYTGTLSNSVVATSTTPDPTPGPCATCNTDPLPPNAQAHLNVLKVLKDHRVRRLSIVLT